MPIQRAGGVGNAAAGAHASGGDFSAAVGHAARNNPGQAGGAQGRGNGPAVGRANDVSRAADSNPAGGRGNNNGRGNGVALGRANNDGQGNGVALGRANNDGQGNGLGPGRGDNRGQGPGSGLGFGRTNNDGQGNGFALGRGDNRGQGQGDGLGFGRADNPGIGHGTQAGQGPFFGSDRGPGPDSMYAMISHGPADVRSGDFGSAGNQLGSGSLFHVTSILDGSFRGPLTLGVPLTQQALTGQARAVYGELAREAQTPKEIYLLNTMFAHGKSPNEAQNALAGLRQWQLLETAGPPGIAFSSQPARTYAGPWLGDLGATIGQVPPQVAGKLAGREFNSFSAFCQAFWRAVADTPELAAQFSAANLARMRNGAPPLAALSQQFEGFSAYMIYHKIPVSQGGAVFDMSNMLIVTPFMYHAILDLKLQNLILNIMHSGHMSVKVLLKRRRAARRSRLKQDFGFGRWARRKLRDLRRRYKSKPKRARKARQTVPTVLIGQILPPLWTSRQSNRRPVRRPYPAVITQTLPNGALGESSAPQLA